MTGPTRRQLLTGLAALGLQGLAGAGVQAAVSPVRLVVVGGGFGGATAARSLKRLLPGAKVTLVEPKERYTACPFSNLVVAGQRELVQQQFSYDALAREGIGVARDAASDVDTASRKVTLAGGAQLPYDRLVLSPGIDFRWGALEGYGRDAVERLPHAWKAGVQSTLLRDQLLAMPAGGVFALSITAAPFRCPPGPYERASLVAEYLSRNNPTAKLLILDSNERFSKQSLFQSAWDQRYGEIVEWRSASNDGRVTRVDADSMQLFTDFEDIRADVINVVPPQKAGAIAARAGVADATGWCPIDARDFSSTLQANVHVIGDATIAAPMPKSAFSANAQAKICAIQIARSLAGLDVEATTLANTCYSFLSPDEAISVSGVYRSDQGRFSNVPGAGGVSPLQSAAGFPEREANQARAWFTRITRETFG